MLWGVGYTFTSGATQAWITDEIGEAAARPIFLRGRQMWLAGGLAGTLLSVSLGLLQIQVPMVLAGVGMLALTAGLVRVMPETRRRGAPSAARSAFRHLAATGRDGFRVAMARPVVKVIVAISLVTGLAAEAWDRLYIPSAIARFNFPTLFGTDSPVLWFGISGAVGTLLGLGASEIFIRTNPAALAAGTPARLLAVCAAIQVVAVATFAVSGNLWLAFGMLWVRTIVGAVGQPVESAWLNLNLDASTRATVISMTGQANSLGQVAGGPALGWVGHAASLRVALLGSALVLAPTVALYRRLIVRDRGTTQPVPTPIR